MSGSIRPELFANSSETSKPNKGGHMAQLTISEAIRRSGIGRTQFYSRYIKKGLVSVSEQNGKKFIDSSELIRVFGEMKAEQSDIVPEQSEQNSTEQVIPDTTAQNEQIKLLREQLAEARQRESFYQEQIINLTNRLEPPKPIKRESWFARFWNAKD